MIGLRVACCAAFFAQAISIIARPSPLPPSWFWLEVVLAFSSVLVGIYVLFRGTEA